MPQLTMNVRDGHNDVFGRALIARLTLLRDAEQAARRRAADAATQKTRTSFKRRRDIAAPRPGRAGTGQMVQHLSWVPKVDQATGTALVEFDRAEADAQAPHWPIQEIGTGKRATLRRAGTANPTGRPKKGASHVIAIKSQIGRRISPGLVFATGGKYSPPGSARGEQLQLASQVRGVPQWGQGPNVRGTRVATGRQAAGIRISKEIEGQHFVKKGGQEGFRQYRSPVLAAARQAFRKSNRP